MTTRKPYRYEATIRLVIYADGQDAAWELAKDAAMLAQGDTMDRAHVESARTSLVDLRYRPTVKERWTGESSATDAR